MYFWSWRDRLKIGAEEERRGIDQKTWAPGRRDHGIESSGGGSTEARGEGYRGGAVPARTEDRWEAPRPIPLARSQFHVFSRRYERENFRSLFAAEVAVALRQRSTGADFSPRSSDFKTFLTFLSPSHVRVVFPAARPCTNILWVRNPRDHSPFCFIQSFPTRCGAVSTSRRV